MRLGSERTEEREWQKLFRSPSTHLEAENTAEWVELNVAVALSLRSDESGGAGGDMGGGGLGDGGGGLGGGGLGDGGGGLGDGGGEGDGGEGGGGDGNAVPPLHTAR